MSYKTKSSVDEMIQKLDSEYKNLITVLRGAHQARDGSSEVDLKNVIIDGPNLLLAIDHFSVTLKAAQSFAKQ